MFVAGPSLFHVLMSFVSFGLVECSITIGIKSIDNVRWVAMTL